MAIKKNNFKVSRLDPEFSTGLTRPCSAIESDSDEYNHADSGAGSDDFESFELGEIGAEFCQIGSQSITIPFKMYDLPDLQDILSLDVWNDCLIEEDRFSLVQYLPDMDQYSFMHTLIELFSGCNFHFGSPVTKLFDMLRGGLCEPKVFFYRQALNYFQKCQHYHKLRIHQNNMVGSLCKIRDAWKNCEEYSIDERLRVVNMMRNQNNLMYGKVEELLKESYSLESVKDLRLAERVGRRLAYDPSQTVDFPSRRKSMTLEPEKYGKKNPRGLLKFKSRKRSYDVSVHNVPLGAKVDRSGILKLGKKYEGSRGEYFSSEVLASSGRNMRSTINPEMKNLTTKLANSSRNAHDYAKKVNYHQNFHQSVVDNQTVSAKSHAWPSALKGNIVEYSIDHPINYDDLDVKMKKWKTARESPDVKLKSYRTSSLQINDRLFHSGYKTKLPGNTIWGNPKGRMLEENDETESGSTESEDEDDIGHSSRLLDGISHSSRSDLGEDVNIQVVGNYFSKEKQKGTIHETCLLYKSHLNGSERRKAYKKGKKVQSCSVGRERRVENIRGYSVNRLTHFRDCTVDNSPEIQFLHYDDGISGRFEEKCQNSVAYTINRSERLNDELLSSNLSAKKRKVKDDVTYKNDAYGDLRSNIKPKFNGTLFKKRGKLKLEANTDTLDMEIFKPPVAEFGLEDNLEVIKPQKKAFTPITPTVHTGFSFSIIHLLSTVRMAMITPHPEDLYIRNQVEKTDGIHNLIENLNISRVPSNVGTGMNNSGHSAQMNVPPLNVLDIVNRVRSNPGDPCILETQEPLQDLVRGVLKIFSSRTAPLGVKGWKALVLYEKSSKSWSWVGPVSLSTSDHEAIEEVISPEAWGLGHKTLLRLVDAFATWLRSGQETLRQIGSLPAPPARLMQFNQDEKERFKDLRAQKSLSTIIPSSEEITDYFRKEEFLRYSIPDRAFSYTAADGKKSIVAPLRRCGGKPTSKARDHFMLKRDRPPHVTILCIVRDAAARLPNSIGTRADVCTLIRDSQYIVEDVSDAQVNQVVSGALDRLHYERDPCVIFDGERKLWVYLHREREEEEFEDDGTSSTKKWKRQKKDPNDQFDHDTGNVASHVNVERDTCGSVIGFDDNSLLWDTLGMNPLPEGRLLCQQNSTNEDFDDVIEPHGFLSGGFM